MPPIQELRDNLRVSLILTTSFATAALLAICLVTPLVIWRDTMALLADLAGTGRWGTVPGGAENGSIQRAPDPV